MSHQLVALTDGYFHSPNFGDLLMRQIVHGRLRSLGLHPVDAYTVASFQGQISGVQIDRQYEGVLRGPGLRGLVFAGGGYLEQPRGRRGWQHLWRRLAVARAVRRHGLPVVMTGIGGARPLSQAAQLLIAALLRQCSIVVARDEETLGLVRDLGSASSAVPGADLVLTLPRRVPPGEQTVSSAVGFHVERPSLDETLALSRRCIDAARSVGCRATLILDHRSTYRPALDAVVAGEDDLDVIGPASPDEMLESLSRFAAVITTKLHVGVAAFSVGVPPFALVSHSKVSRFYHQVGLAQHTTPLDGPDRLDDVLKSWLLAARTGAAMERYESAYLSAADLRDRAGASLGAVDHLLEGPHR